MWLSKLAVGLAIQALLMAPATIQQAALAGDGDEAASAGWQHHRGDFHFRSTPGSQYSLSGKDAIRLAAGSLLIDSHRPITVSTPMATTIVRSGTLLLVRVQAGNDRILIVHDNNHGKAKLVCEKFFIRLAPGEDALVTDHEPAYREIVGHDEIGRRRVKVHNIHGDSHVTTSEYSILQALERDPLLYELCRSRHRRDRTLKGKIIKTAAILSQVTSDHGFFHSSTSF